MATSLAAAATPQARQPSRGKWLDNVHPVSQPLSVQAVAPASGLRGQSLTSLVRDSIMLSALRSKSDPKLITEPGASKRLLPSMELGLPSIWVWGVCRGMLLLAADEAHNLGVLCALCKDAGLASDVASSSAATSLLLQAAVFLLGNVMSSRGLLCACCMHAEGAGL